MDKAVQFDTPWGLEDQKDRDAGLYNIPSLEQDKRIRQLETDILELQKEIHETGVAIHNLRQETGSLGVLPPMCKLKEGHKGPCDFE